MIYKKHSNLNLPITVSIVLHVLFLAFLSYNSWQYTSNSGLVDGQSINAIMIDPSTMTQEYQKNLQNQISIAQNKSLTLSQKKQQDEPQKSSEVKKEQLNLVQQENQRAVEEAKKKTEQAKQELEKAKLEIEKTKQKAEQEKRKAEQARLKAENIKKEAKIAKDEKALKDILGGLTSNKPQAKKGVPNSEQDSYVALVQNAISNKFSNPSKLYSGRKCLLKISINDDGLLLDVVSNGGDPALCRDAIAATRQATIPKPPKALYQTVKQMVIDFQPK